VSIQHADAYVASRLYDTTRPNWRTPESVYAVGYLDWRIGRRSSRPARPLSLQPERATAIRQRIRQELER
jgi:hypothetical protein